MTTPYYADDAVTLYHGDARAILPTLGTVDCVVTDPPYGDTALGWDAIVPGWLALVRPLLAPHGSVWAFGSLRFLVELCADARSGGWRLAQDVVWEKQNGSGFATDRFKRVHEQAAHLYPADVKWGAIYNAVPRVEGEARPSARIATRRAGPPHTGAIGATTYEYGDTRQARSVIYAPNMQGRALHPTQKPEQVVAPLVACSCPPGGLVLDPFAGSGTTGVVAKSSGRRAVLIEGRADFCEIIANRLQQTMALGGAA